MSLFQETIPAPETPEQVVQQWCRDIFGAQACTLMLRASDVRALLERLDVAPTIQATPTGSAP